MVSKFPFFCVAITTGFLMVIATSANAIQKSAYHKKMISFEYHQELVNNEFNYNNFYGQNSDKEKSSKDNLIGVVWHLQEIRYNNDELIQVEQPSNYTIEFLSEGKVAIQADCNRAIGTYTENESSISIAIGPITLAQCPPESVSDQYLRDIQAARIFFFQDGNLYLDLFADTGTMMFKSQNTLMNKDDKKGGGCEN